MTGVQTLVPIMLDRVNAGRLSLMRLVDLTSAGPARLFGIARKGRIAVGYGADLTVIDLKRRETITAGSNRAQAGPPMMGSPSPAGRSGPSCEVIA
jgi:dihydroorotase